MDLLLSSIASRAMGSQLMQSDDIDVSDLDLLSLILTSTDMRINATEVALNLLSVYGSFSAIIGERPKVLAEFAGMTSRATAYLKFIHLMRIKIMREELSRRSPTSSLDDIVNYLRVRFMRASYEEVRVIFLTSRLAFISDEVVARGSLVRCDVYPEIILRRALELHSPAIILSHNHPSGNAQPSDDDLRFTRRMVSACALLNVQLLDNFVVTDRAVVSIMSDGLVRTFESGEQARRSDLKSKMPMVADSLVPS